MAKSFCCIGEEFAKITERCVQKYRWRAFIVTFIQKRYNNGYGALDKRIFEETLNIRRHQFYRNLYPKLQTKSTKQEKTPKFINRIVFSRRNAYTRV